MVKDFISAHQTLPILPGLDDLVAVLAIPLPFDLELGFAVRANRCLQRDLFGAQRTFFDICGHVPSRGIKRQYCSFARMSLQAKRSSFSACQKTASLTSTTCRALSLLSMTLTDFRNRVRQYHYRENKSGMQLRFFTTFFRSFTGECKNDFRANGCPPRSFFSWFPS
jgi:hypothetical protein